VSHIAGKSRTSGASTGGRTAGQQGSAGCVSVFRDRSHSRSASSPRTARQRCTTASKATTGLNGRNMPKGDVKHGSFETGAVVLSWFVLNIAMGSSTKWIFLYGEICFEHPTECRTFKFPLAITVIHMIFSWVMCYIQLFYIRKRPVGAGLTLRQQLEKVAPLSICFSLSVAMGNLSLKYIFPSFNQMLGSMSPLITVAMAVVLQRKSYNWWTWLSMPVICGGLAVCSATEVNFNLLGAFYATGATVLRALKSIMQGKLLTSGENLDSVTLLFYMAPWAALFLSFIAAFSEGLEPHILLLQGLMGSVDGSGPADPGYRRVTGGWNVFILLVISGLNACLLNVANFMVTSYTSPVTLQVLGNVKSCLAIGVSVAIFRNTLTVEQGVGVAGCLFGVWLYNQKGGPSSSKEASAGPASRSKADSTPPATPVLEMAVASGPRGGSGAMARAPQDPGTSSLNPRSP